MFYHKCIQLDKIIYLIGIIMLLTYGEVFYFHFHFLLILFELNFIPDAEQ